MKNKGDFRFIAIYHIYTGLGLPLNDIDAFLMYLTSVTHFLIAIYGNCPFPSENRQINTNQGLDEGCCVLCFL